jgi:hypothetical protein
MGDGLDAHPNDSGILIIIPGPAKIKPDWNGNAAAMEFAVFAATIGV